jgi:cysteine desulfurase family protein (TIGR01976 family)
MNPTNQPFPIKLVRSQFPALNRVFNGKPVVYFDGPGGSQVVKSAMDAIFEYMAQGGANLHGSFPSSRDTEAIISDSKLAVADLFGVKEQEVAFGANMTTLNFAISRAIGRFLKEGDEIVLSELDHRANVDPWLTMAVDRGVTVRWIPVNPQTFTLDLNDLDKIINSNTRLVAVGLASNAVGTINDVRYITSLAHKFNAIVAVDAVHAVPHFSINRDQIAADILLCSAYKFFGPHVGIAVIREELFEQLNTYKLAPAPTYIPDKLETGTQNHEGIAGIKPAIEFIASLGEGTTRKEKIESGLRNIENYENVLASKIRKALSKMKGITLFQADGQVPRTPTIAFRVEKFSPQEVCQVMSEEYGVFIADGDFYATTLADKLDINRTGGWVRAGLAPYNTEEEADTFIEGLRQLVNRR